MTSLSARIALALKHAGISAADLARSTHNTESAVSQWISGETKSIRSANALKVAKACGVSVDWLVTGHGKMIKDRALLGPMATGAAPVIAWHNVPHWNGRTDDSQSTPIAWRHCPVTHSESTYVLRVNGPSMEPRFTDGQEIFVDPDATIESGRFVIVTIGRGQEPIFRQYIEDGGKRYLKATNPAWPSSIIELGAESRICGVVIYTGYSV